MKVKLSQHRSTTLLSWQSQHKTIYSLGLIHNKFILVHYSQLPCQLCLFLKREKHCGILRVFSVMCLIMFKNFLQLGLLLQFSKQPNIMAFQPITENNHVLVGHVFRQLFARDWFNCIQACHDEPRCISYNYQRSAGANGLCELNDCGVESLCDRHSSLIYSKGFVFQQIRESKVSDLR